MKRIYFILVMLLGSLLTADAQTSTQNYVRTKRYMDNSSYLENIDYYDGLGRIAQQNSRGITPGGNDLVTLHEYDGFGRESKVWLPTPSSANGAWVEVTTLKNAATTAYDDSKPYGQYFYEQSPQNRVVEEYKAGEAWSEHPKQILYDTSMSYWYLNPSPMSCMLPVAHGEGYLRCKFAGVGTLYVTQSTDEDGKVSYEFRDKKGRVTMIRRMDGTTPHSTYYVYDHLERLSYILPPMAADALRGINEVVSDTLSCLQKYAYIYRYDKRGNLKYKKLPGSEPIYYVYDKGDRLIFTQNGEQRTRGEWSFTFPDAFGRTVLEGTCSVSLNYNNNPLTETVVNATRTNATDANKGYTISGISVTNMQIHRVNYYDNYAFIGQNSVPTTLSYTTPESGYGTRYESHYKGLLTGSIIARWENNAVSGYDYAAYYYDQQGNVVQEKRTNHLGGLETYQHAYDRLGNPLKKKHVHTASGKTTRTEELAYTYDCGARPTKVTHKLNSGSTVTLAEYTYDEFCRMANKFLGGSSSNQQIYQYNIRGWITKISGPMFTESLSYIDGSGSPCYNGNISSINFSVNTGYPAFHSYTYNYDGLDRLTTAAHLCTCTYPTEETFEMYTEKVTGYDKNGNILGLQRYGQTGASSYGLVDNLTYTYNGNKVTRVDDATTATSYTGGTNFINGANTNNEYTYDQNGNLTKDLNKGIANITYNLLSLPQVVTFSDGSTIRYMYSADGTKLKATHVINGTTTTTDYCGNVIYENGTAKKLLTDGGYVDLTTTTPTYYYYLTDHQGNNRAVISAAGSSVLETNHYYPFGGLFSTSTNVQPYKYNGKELDTKGGLNLYDYGARHYDAALGRFHTQDRFAEKFSALSPYQYGANSPICNVDINGDSIINVKVVDRTKTIQGNSTLYIDHTIYEDVKNMLTFAVDNNIKIHLNSSFRTNKKQSGLNSSNATTPAKPGRSPHNAGIGVDFNLYKDGEIDTGNSNVNSNTPFIQKIKDMGWRWGGEFSKPDKIHMDKRGTEEDFLKMRDDNQKQMNGDFEVEALDKYIKRFELLEFK